MKGYNPADYFERKEQRIYDKFTQFAIIASNEAIAQSGANFDELNRHRIGVVWGSGNGGMRTFHDEAAAYGAGDGTPRFNPYLIPKTW